MNTGIPKTDAASRLRLRGAHPELRRLFEALADGPTIFSLTEVLRTLKRQETLFKSGASTTMKSRHLTGHAADVAIWLDMEQDGTPELRWDTELYRRFAVEVKAKAKELGIDIEWGGDWKSFFDGPHWQLSHKKYPA